MKVNILGFEYEILIDESKLEKACEENNFEISITWGLHDIETRKIYVSSALNDEQIIQTLLHECLHAIGTIAGHAVLSKSTQKNEAFIDAIANGLLSILKNPQVYSEIGKRLGHTRRRCKKDGQNCRNIQKNLSDP